MRKLHDNMLQNLHALDTMGHQPGPSFITSLIQLKLDLTTLFAWKENSKDSVNEISSYKVILHFLDQRARSADNDIYNKKITSSSTPSMKQAISKTVTTYVTSSMAPGKCQLCHGEKHPLYICPKFKSMTMSE